jgi:DNA-binding FrmR family transcriptional regulator
MIAEDRDCRDVLQQLIAIQSAVRSATLNFMQEVASDCLLNPDGEENALEQRERMSELIQMLGKVS